MKGLGGVLGRKANPNLVSRGFAGVLLAQPSGEKLVKVEAVLPGSPAEKAGLKAGDHLVAVDGEPTTDAASFFAAISKAKKGQELRLKVDRAGAGQEIVLLLEGGI
jgi:regulator of sigma E protease